MPETILHIDDEPAISAALLVRLRAAGFDVISAPDGPRGLDAAETQPPDAILLDLRMPGMDGFEVFRRLKANPRLAAIPVIFLTAEAGPEARQRARELGAAGFIAKPFEAREIIEALVAVTRGDTGISPSASGNPADSAPAGGAAPGSVNDQRPPTRGGQSMSSTRRILLADDDEGFVKAISVRLQQEGYEVVVARDGYYALHAAVEHKPDLLILDVHMPAGDGFTVQQRKDRMSPLADVPVIYVTGDKSDRTKLRAENAGAVAVLHKPFEFDELRAAIDEALAKRAA